MSMRLILLFLFLGTFYPNFGMAKSKETYEQVEARIDFPPQIMTANNQAFLVYELNITNFIEEPINLESVSVKDEKSSIIKFSSSDLNNMIIRNGVSLEKTPLTLQPGVTAVIGLWIPFKSAAHVPTTLVHAISYHTSKISHPLTITMLPMEVSLKNPLIVGKPLKGKKWFTVAPSNFSHHRKQSFFHNGIHYFAQRFAIDFTQVDEAGNAYKGDPNKNTSYYSYGKDILAIASGKVVAMLDSIPDSIPPGNLTNPVNLPLHEATGNHLIIDMGFGQYAFYAHFIPGSINFEVGDWVNKGDILGKLGNSGNSSAPHLHMQIVSSPSAAFANGLPFGFETFTLHPLEQHNGEGKIYTNQLFIGDAIVDFD